MDVDEYLPPGSSAVVAVVDDKWADKVENALVKSDKRIEKAIDSGDVSGSGELISLARKRGKPAQAKQGLPGPHG